MQQSRWITPSIFVIAVVAAASVGMIGSGGAEPIATTQAEQEQATSTGHEHHASPSIELPEGVALHGITPIENSRADHLDAELTPAGTQPRALAVDDQGALWIAGATGGIEIRSEGMPTQTLKLGGTLTSLAALDGKMFVADMDGDTVTIFDIETRKRLRQVAVPDGPVALAASTDRVWVASVRDGLVTSIDPRTGDISKPLSVGYGPIALAIARQELAVVNSLDRQVVLFDIRGDQPKLKGRVNVPSGASDAVYAGGALYVAASSAGSVVRIDTQTGRVTKTISLDESSVPGLGPSTLLSAGSQLLVVNSRDRTLSALATGDGSVTSTRTFGLIGNATPVTMDAVIWRGSIVIADADAGVLARLTEVRS